MNTKQPALLSTEAKTQRVKGWRRDFRTGLSIVPQGEFVPSDRYGKNHHSAWPGMPVLMGDFDPMLFDSTTEGLPLQVACGWQDVNGTASLSFRVQRGPDQLCWYANPADPQIWEAMDGWERYKQAAFAYQQSDQDALMRATYDCHQHLQRLRYATSFHPEIRRAFSDKYIQVLAAGIVTGATASRAETLIPALPLRHVQECIIRTDTTGSVLVNVVD